MEKKKEMGNQACWLGCTCGCEPFVPQATRSLISSKSHGHTLGDDDDGYFGLLMCVCVVALDLSTANLLM